MTEQPIEHVPGQQELPDPPATPDPAGDDDGQGDDETAGVPYDEAYSVPDAEQQQQLDAAVPDEVPDDLSDEQLLAAGAGDPEPATDAAGD